jgi:SAM-dependent methyltransferase
MRFNNEFLKYQVERSNNWNFIYNQRPKSLGFYYRSQLIKIYRHLIPENQRVLEIGCGKGDLLAAIKPSFGLGIDFSSCAIELANKSYPHLHFNIHDAHCPLKYDESFDYIILSDLTNDLWDIQNVLENILSMCDPRTRIIFNFHSHLWGIPLDTAKRMGLVKPTLTQNWITASDLNNFLQLSGYQSLKNWSDIILPIQIPFLSNFVNRYFSKLWAFKIFNISNFCVARPFKLSKEKSISVSVVIAARNEEGHIEELINRIPQMGNETEIIFVEGNSSDDTYGEIERAIKRHTNLKIKLFKQLGRGKGDAVRKGFDEASGDILMILDADITVPPEDLPRFYECLVQGKAEFVNGVRLVYPMEKQAMRFFNLIGNKFFSYAFSWLLGQPIRDTLCGTKVLWRKDYQRIAQNRAYFGDFDPFGDFDLLFGAARLNLHILEIPIRYRARSYGETNISRWKHGWLLLRMVLFAAKRIKFV